MVNLTQEEHLYDELWDVLQETDGNHCAEQEPGWEAVKPIIGVPRQHI